MLPESTAATLNLQVAGVPVQLQGGHDELGVPDILLPFVASGNVRHGEGILLSLEEGPPPDRPDGPLGRNGATTVISTRDRFWLRARCGGIAVANPELSVWQCWRRPNEPFIDVVAGNRGLMLALWGYLALRGGTYLHGAVCVMEGRYMLVLGDSGVGKSTLSGLVLAAGGSCLTDEHPFVTVGEGERPFVHGSLRPGVKGPLVPLSAPLDAVFFLRHAPANEIQRLSLSYAGRRFLGNTRFFHWLPATIPETFNTLDKIARQVPVYDFGFVPDLSAVELLFHGLRQGIF